MRIPVFGCKGLYYHVNWTKAVTIPDPDRDDVPPASVLNLVTFTSETKKEDKHTSHTFVLTGCGGKMPTKEEIEEPLAPTPTPQPTPEPTPQPTPTPTPVVEKEEEQSASVVISTSGVDDDPDKDVPWPEDEGYDPQVYS